MCEFEAPAEDIGLHWLWEGWLNTGRLRESGKTLQAEEPDSVMWGTQKHAICGRKLTTLQ
jgi:hypothetical protein